MALFILWRFLLFFNIFIVISNLWLFLAVSFEIQVKFFYIYLFIWLHQLCRRLWGLHQAASFVAVLWVFSGCGLQAWVPQSIWDLSSWPGIKPESLALQNKCLTTGPLGKSCRTGKVDELLMFSVRNDMTSWLAVFEGNSQRGASKCFEPCSKHITSQGLCNFPRGRL